MCFDLIQTQETLAQQAHGTHCEDRCCPPWRAGGFGNVRPLLWLHCSLSRQRQTCSESSGQTSPKIACPFRSGSKPARSDVPRQEIWTGASATCGAVPHHWPRLCQFTRHSRQQHRPDQHAASQFCFQCPRAQCAKRPLGLASYAFDTRFLPAVWIMSIMSSLRRGPSMLPVWRSVLQRMRYDQFARPKEGDQAAGEVG